MFLLLFLFVLDLFSLSHAVFPVSHGIHFNEGLRKHGISLFVLQKIDIIGKYT